MSKKRFKLDPTKTAQENLWDAMSVAAVYMLKRFKITNKQEEWLEIFDEVRVRAVRHFIDNRVMQHKYDRRFSFIQNCISSVWAIISDTIRIYIRDNRRRITNLSMDTEIEGTVNLNLESSISDTGTHPLYYPRIPKNSYIAILDAQDRELIDVHSLKGRQDVSHAFEALWAIEDSCNEMEGSTTPATVEEHRDEIREKIKTLPEISAYQLQRRKQMQRYRHKKKAAN